MASLTTGKIAEVIFENAMETFETQDMLLDKVEFWQPDAQDLQNASNVIWRSVEQHAPILTGWDMSSSKQGIIQETYPAVLGEPKNDMVELRADDLRDIRFWEQRGEASGRRQASELNSSIADAMVNQGSMFYRSNTTSGYEFIAEAQALMNERQLVKDMRHFMLNDRDTLAFGSDLAARQTLQGRPEQTWKTGQIGQNVAEFDVYTGSFLPNLDGGSSPDATVTGDQSFAPSGGSVNSTTLVVTNVDYREADIPVSSSGSYTVGDKVTFRNSGVAVNAIGLDDKTDTDQPMTFTIVDIPDGTTITVFPKPIAADDTGNLTELELAYANVDTQILDGAVVDRINTETSTKANLFWNKSAVEVMGGSVPAQLFKEFAGQRVISSAMKNGQMMYMLYDGDIETMNFQFRLFTWYGITICNPSAVGVASRFAAT